MKERRAGAVASSFEGGLGGSSLLLFLLLSEVLGYAAWLVQEMKILLENKDGIYLSTEMT
jgi:hypothetical protein